MCILLHRSNLSNLANFRPKIDDFSANLKFYLQFLIKVVGFRTDFDEIFSDLRKRKKEKNIFSDFMKFRENLYH